LGGGGGGGGGGNIGNRLKRAHRRGQWCQMAGEGVVLHPPTPLSGINAAHPSIRALPAPPEEWLMVSCLGCKIIICRETGPLTRQ